MRRLIFILLAMIGVSRAQTIQYIGAPTTTVISRGNFRTDSIFYLPKRSKAPTDTAAFRYQISDSSLYVWTGSQWIKAGGSGTISGSGITGYLPQFSASTTLDTSALFTLGNRLGIGSSTFAYTSTNTANIELNGTAGGILGFKRNDSARGYLWHTGDNMELANTAAGSISFNTNSATRGSISSAGVWRLHNLAGTGDRVVQASSNGTLSATTSVTGLVDTTTISTRAWRQKGDDSLGAIIATKGSGTVTSVATGYGLSGGTITTTGTLLVDTLNIATRAWRQKGLDSLAALEVSGSGTTNYVPKFTAGTTIGNSQIFDNGTNVGLGTASPSVKLDVVGSAGTIVRTKGGTGSAQGSAYYVQLAGSTSTLSAFGDRANIFGGTVDQIASIYTGSSIPLTFDVNAAERMRITSGGDVGIGTSSPISGSVLDVTSSTNVYPRIRSTGTGEAFQFYQNSTSGTTAADGLFVGINSGNDAFFYNSEATPARFFTSAAERLRIFANGRVGINTTTDAGYHLDVNGTLRSVNGANFATTSGNVGVGITSPLYKMHVYNTSGESSLFLESGTTTQAALYLANANNAIFNDNSTTNNLKFFVNSATRMTINSSGNVGIGTTTINAKLHVLSATGTAQSLGDWANNIAIIQGASRTGTTTVGGSFATTLSLQSNDDVITAGTGASVGFSAKWNSSIYGSAAQFASIFGGKENGSDASLAGYLSFATRPAGGNPTERGRINSAGEWIIDASGTDAGDYKLQVSGNALVTAGKLDITTNTGFGLSVTRSGTSVVAGQINNSNGILYYGAESSTGGGLFTGSSAYAAVIGSGAAYPLQFATDNVTRATINTNGELLINTLTDNGDFKLQVNGSALISGSIQTANPVSGTAVPWRLGSVVATNVQLDTSNYVEVNINGTFYRLAIVTPL